MQTDFSLSIVFLVGCCVNVMYLSDYMQLPLQTQKVSPSQCSTCVNVNSDCCERERTMVAECGGEVTDLTDDMLV